ncbi:MAG: hypothetical protein GYA14_07230 [Ignavibacteria bacterium]|nr:hypothetical protein [Ignavibacteria bacterium]
MKDDWNTTRKRGYLNISKRNDVKRKMSLAKTGKKREKSNAWKGNSVSYYAIHMWIKSTLGKASCCEFCKTKTAKRYEWANKTGKYDRLDKNDWIQLCTPCHRRYDLKNKIVYPRNKR